MVTISPPAKIPHAKGPGARTKLEIVSTEKRTQLAQQAFKRLTEHYSAKQNAESYLTIYQDLVFL